MNDDKALDERMKAAGMMPVSEMLERNALGKFSACAEVRDLESFEQWIQQQRMSYLRMQARMTLDREEKDEMFEWVIAHNAVLGDVIANFRQANQPKPLTGETEQPHPGEQQDPSIDTKRAIEIAELWQAGKMIGGDEDDVRNILLTEVKRLTKELNKHKNPDFDIEAPKPE